MEKRCGTKRLLLFGVFLLVFCGFGFADDSVEAYKIIGCFPNSLTQGTTNATITILTEKPLPQKTLDEFLYSSVYFSNPGVHIKKVSFKNSLTMICILDIDRDALLSEEHNPVDVSIVSYDEYGFPFTFKGQKMFTIKRKPFVESITVDTPSGKIVRGKNVKLNLRGKNFVPGTIKAVLMWSGIDMLSAECANENEVTVDISSDETAKISRTGNFGVYFYNSDGSANQADVTVEVIDNT